MKIIEITTMFGGGSVGRIATSCYKVLIENGHDCIIAYGRGVPPQNIKSYKIGGKLSIYSHVLITRLFDATGYGSYFATRKLIKFIDKYNPDVIHLHNLHGYYINVFLLFKFIKRRNIKVVWTFHDCWPFTGHCPYYSLEKCEKWKEQCHNCPRANLHPKSWLIDASIRNFNAKKEAFTNVKDLVIITPSQWMKLQVEQSFLKEYPVNIINNGINQKIFYPHRSDYRRANALENKKIVLGVANVWGYGKGYDIFLRLAQDLDVKFQIILVGLTEKQKRELPSNIIGIEHTESADQLVELYSIADVFLNPTRCDNFPTTNLEALSCGTPVITFSDTGSPEAVDNSCGEVVAQDDYNSIVKAIIEFTNAPKDVASCLRRAEHFSEEFAYKQYLELYKGLLSADK